LVTCRGDAPDVEHKELVLVFSPFYPHKLAKGYANPSAGVLDSVNACICAACVNWLLCYATKRTSS
jgi:hypothetical protein